MIVLTILLASQLGAAFPARAQAATVAALTATNHWWRIGKICLERFKGAELRLRDSEQLRDIYVYVKISAGMHHVCTRLKLHLDPCTVRGAPICKIYVSQYHIHMHLPYTPWKILPIPFHDTAWLIGIPIMGYHNRTTPTTTNQQWYV